jgi:hypothetical protein
MFRLTPVEFENLMFHIGTSSWGGRRKLPNAFTEAGVAMLSSVLNSSRAIKDNIQIIRIFTKLRIAIQSHPKMLRLIEEIQKKDIEQDQQPLLIFEYLKKLERSKQLKFNGYRTRNGCPFSPGIVRRLVAAFN